MELEGYDQVTVYVVWREGSSVHPLGDALWRWFNVAEHDGLPSAAGLPVYFRSRIDADGRLSPPLSRPARGRAMNFAVLLIDAKWVNDPDWCDAAGALVGADDTEVLYVPLHPNAGTAHPLLASAQQVPLVRRDGEGDAEALRRGLTQTLARRVRARLGLPERRPTVFISHAKADGREDGLQLKRAVQDYGQLDAFFDEQDLLWGSPDWAEQLRRGVLDGSDGMLVLETDVYASRPWCRAEVEMARAPRRVGTEGVDARIWTVLPTVILGRPGGRWSKVLPELGNVPRIGCDGDFAVRAIDRLMLEVLLAAVNRLRARAVAAARDAACEVLTFLPSPETLRRVRSEVGPKADIAYPGDGLYRFEIPRLMAADAALERQRACLHTYADWVHRGPVPWAPPLPSDVVVAVSVSESADRAALGIGAVHENATLSRLTQELVRAGARVMYGGVLAGKDDKGENKLQPIVDAVVAHARSAEAGQGLPPQPPLINPQALPFYRKIDDDTQARLRGVVQFVFVDPPGWRAAQPDDPDAVPVGPVSAEAAAALREMRRVMARGATLDRRGRVTAAGKVALPPVNVRLALGGKVSGYLGILPGIAEEYLEDREAGRPVIASTRYGGCAGRIADYLLGGALAPELTWAWARVQAFYAGLLAVVPEDEARARWDALQARLDADRAVLQAGGSTVEGLDRQHLERLMRTESDGELIHGVLRLVTAA